MKKIIKLPIESTTQIRKTEDSLCELYSHDKNNGLFEFEVTNVKLGNEKPYAMFKFMDSQSVWKVLGTIEDNKIKVAFDTTLITQDETVVCFLYLDDEERTTDFYRFKFKVKVSEIDKLHTYAVKERYFNNSIIVDKLDVVTKDELKEALKGLTVSTIEGVLTENRADEIYAKKSELYDDSDLRGRVEALESKPDNNTVYDDTVLTNRVKALEDRPTGSSYDDSDLQGRVRALEDAPKINATDFATKNDLVAFNGELNNKVSSGDFEDFKKTIPAPYNDSELSKRVTALENKPSTGEAVTSATSSEIRGTGMPNGVVEAPIGTTYIDTAKTNGALKWIKTTDGGNTGWKVVEGDTGWITIFQGIVWRDFVNRLMIRRINNTVNVVFEGLGDAEGIFFDKTAHPHNLDLVNVKVVDGFKPISRITLPTLNYASFYDEDGVFTIGTITFDVIDGMFKITLFSEQDRVNRMSNGLANINFNYVTYEEWPTELPGQN